MSLRWTKRKEARPVCDNAGSGTSTIVPDGCYRSVATRRVRIEYNEVEEDVLDLCDSCAKKVVEDAQKHGYRTSVTRLEGEGT